MHTPYKKSITCFRKNELLKDQKNDIIFGLKHNSIIEKQIGYVQVFKLNDLSDI